MSRWLGVVALLIGVSLGAVEGAERALKQALVAAEAGSAAAMSHLGWMYETGEGVPVDAALAVHWYSKAAKAGAPEYARKVGWMYLSAQGVPQDRELAEYWFRQGIAGGDSESRLALASIYVGDGLSSEAGAGVRDAQVTEAIELLEEVLSDGDVRATYFLTRIYLEGIGGYAVEPKRAAHYASLGANEGMPGLQGFLSSFYFNGFGVEADLIQAAKWARLASAAGDPVGMQVWSAVQNELTEAQLEKAQRLALRWADRE